MVFFALILFIASTTALWPYPRNINIGDSIIKLSPTFTFAIEIENPPQDLVDAVSRSEEHIRTDNLQRLVPDRGLNDSSVVRSALSLSTVRLEITGGVNSISVEAMRPVESRVEGYSLVLPENGTAAVITSKSSLGLLHGLSTFEQLWYTLGEDIYTNIAPVTIADDEPSYPYRGFMLDTARNFFPVDDIKRTLDTMSSVKMNQFHWHIVDSQSFPLEVSDFPQLSQRGAYSLSEIYTTEDVQDIVTYAGVRGIDVLMEIDTPGHTSVISTSYPEHVACVNLSPWSDYAAEPPSGQLRIASNATTNFTSTLLASVASTLPSSLFSTGGDEVNLQCYMEDEQTQQELNATGRTLDEALSDFTVATHTALENMGKTPVVWEEMVLTHNITLSNETVVMVWISSDDAAAVVNRGFRIVHAPSDYFYLDCGAGEWIGNSADLNSWCDPFKSWQKSYTFDPLNTIPLDKQHLVLGGQQLLWTEQSSPENLDSIVWPRAAVSAEVFWTAGNGSVVEALPRLHELRYRMVQRGVRAIALQPYWCALRNGQCTN